MIKNLKEKKRFDREYKKSLEKILSMDGVQMFNFVMGLQMGRK